MNQLLMKIKNMILFFSLLVCGLFVLTHKIPTLPTAADNFQMLSGSEGILLYLQCNLFPILFFTFCIVMGLLLLRCGIFFHKNTLAEKDYRIFLMLSCFMVLSGIWMLTDSSALIPFGTDQRAVTLTSYLSFLLMAVVLVRIFSHIFPDIHYIQTYDLLLSANIALFVLFILTDANITFYFINLIIHHLVCFLLIFLIIKRFLKTYAKEQNPSQNFIFFGLFLFSCFGGAALIAFLANMKQFYSIFYGIGLLCLSYSILKSLFAGAMDAYKNQVALSPYKELAYTDSLCGIGNRNAFYREQQNSIDATKLCYIIFDVNGLKRINDGLGHSAGDKLISSSAALIQQAFSSCGKCFRIGGDEFAVISTELDETSVSARLKELERLIADFNKDAPIPVSLAYGYSLRRSLEESVETLFHEADMAMYNHKASTKK